MKGNIADFPCIVQTLMSWYATIAIVFVVLLTLSILRLQERVKKGLFPL